MGNSPSSKFQAKLALGDEQGALRLQAAAFTTKGFDPREDRSKLRLLDEPKNNISEHNVFHLACIRGLPAVLQQMLQSYKLGQLIRILQATNTRNQNALHACAVRAFACSLPVPQLDAQKAACLRLLVETFGAADILALDSRDARGNTPLHYASYGGLTEVCDYLISRKADITLKNTDHKTPADLAEEGRFRALALKLEADVLFGGNDEAVAAAGTFDNPDLLPPDQPAVRGLKLQDVRAEKDELLIQVADMVGLSMEQADHLLRHFEYDKRRLVDAFLGDPQATLRQAGLGNVVLGPGNAFGGVGKQSQKPPRSGSNVGAAGADDPQANDEKEEVKEEDPRSCPICGDDELRPEDCGEDDTPVEMLELGCGHFFCRDCWQEYLTRKVQEADVRTLTCPGFKCPVRVTNAMVEDMVDAETARKFLQFDLKSYVESNPDVKWCPAPDCGRVIRRPQDNLQIVGCGNGHFFCFDCLGEAHYPCTCDEWQRWLDTLREQNVSMDSDGKGAADMASEIWLKNNTKQCPRCKVSLMRSAGCNHFTCRACRHEFCWICMRPWSTHGQATGGYFKCNDFAGEGPNTAQDEIRRAEQKEQETSVFVHFFERFSAHHQSHRLEQPMRKVVFHETEVVIERFIELCLMKPVHSTNPQFLEQAFDQLALSRLTLRNSFAKGFLSLKQLRPEKQQVGNGFLKQVQTEQGRLMSTTEVLSDLVARPHLRGSRAAVVHAALQAYGSRAEFVECLRQLAAGGKGGGGRRRRGGRNKDDSGDDSDDSGFERHLPVFIRRRLWENRKGKRQQRQVDEHKQQPRDGGARDDESAARAHLRLVRERADRLRMVLDHPQLAGVILGQSGSDEDNSNNDPGGAGEKPQLVRSVSSQRHWVCPACTLHNPESALECQACDTRQPDHVVFLEASNGNGSASGSAAGSADGVAGGTRILRCDACSFDNEVAVTGADSDLQRMRRCQVCRNVLPLIQPEKQQPQQPLQAVAARLGDGDGEVAGSDGNVGVQQAEVRQQANEHLLALISAAVSGGVVFHQEAANPARDRGGEGGEAEAAGGGWGCAVCTFLNPPTAEAACEMCESARD